MSTPRAAVVPAPGEGSRRDSGLTPGLQRVSHSGDLADTATGHSAGTGDSASLGTAGTLSQQGCTTPVTTTFGRQRENLSEKQLWGVFFRSGEVQELAERWVLYESSLGCPINSSGGSGSSGFGEAGLRQG